MLVRWLLGSLAAAGSSSTSTSSWPRISTSRSSASRSIRANSSRKPLHDCTRFSPTNTIRSSGLTPACLGGRAGAHHVDVGRRALEHVGHQHEAQLREIDRLGRLQLWRCPAAGRNLPARICLDRAAQFVDGNRVVEPDVVLRVAQLLAEHRQQLAVLIGQRPAGRAGIVGHGVEHVDRAVIGRFERAAAGVEPRLDRDRAVLHAGRLVAGRPRRTGC